MKKQTLLYLVFLVSFFFINSCTKYLIQDQDQEDGELYPLKNEGEFIPELGENGIPLFNEIWLEYTYAAALHKGKVMIYARASVILNITSKDIKLNPASLKPVKILFTKEISLPGYKLFSLEFNIQPKLSIIVNYNYDDGFSIKNPISFSFIKIGDRQILVLSKDIIVEIVAEENKTKKFWTISR